jgi:hypothetical protein
MAGLRFIELQSRPLEFLDFTSVTLDEFQQLVPPFEAAFHARMAAWRMDGKPRTARRFTVEFIPIKSWAARGSGAPGNCAGHSRAPSRDRGRPLSTDGSGL